MSSFAIYMLGMIVVAIGLAVAASMMGVPTVWIAIGLTVVIGLGIISGVARTRRPDPPVT